MKKVNFKSKVIIFSLSMALLFFIIIYSTIGTADISPIDSLRIILSRLAIVKSYVDVSDISSSSVNIIWNLRLPRIILGALVGFSLSVAGTSYQGIFKNPMADPYIIGISSGAAFGATLAMVFNIDFKFLNLPSTVILAFIFSLLSVGLVYFLANRKEEIQVNTLLLSGIAVGYFLNALISFFMVIYTRKIENIIFWTMGNLAGKGWEPIKILISPIIVSSFFLIYFSYDLNMFLLGDEFAKTSGVDIKKKKTLILIFASLITAVSVAFSGLIGFVGLVIPHISRIIFGPDNRKLIPISGILGSIFLISSDTIARTIISPTELPVGIITAMFGTPFFIYLLKFKKS